MRKTIADVLLAIIFLAISLLNLYIAVGLVRSERSEQYVKTTAVVIEVETVTLPDRGLFGIVRKERHTTVAYSVNDKPLTAQLIDAPKKYVEGTELTIFYNVDEPTEISLSDIRIGGVVIVMIGLLIAALLIVVLCKHGLFDEY